MPPRPEPELETHWPGWVELEAGRGARTEWESERKWVGDSRKVLGMGDSASRGSNPGGVSGWRCGKGRSPGCRSHGLGVSEKQGQDMDSSRVPEAACERGQQDRGGRGERTQVGMGWASHQHPIEELWGAGGRRQWPLSPVLSCCFSGCSSGLCAGPRMSPLALRGLCPSSHAYLFIY